MTDTDKPVIIITGASSGIGKATAKLFSSHGYRVVLAARRLGQLQDIVEDILKIRGEAVAVQTDVSMYEDIEHLIEETLKYYGQIDVLFNNAGFGHMNWLENFEIETDIQHQLKVNLEGLILLSREVLPHMIERRCGHIINMSSLAGFISTPTYSIYAASKFGIRGFTEALRREVGIWGIHVTGIYPGGVKSEFRDHMGMYRKTGITTPSWLLLSSEEVAEAVYQATIRPHRAVVLPKIMFTAIFLNRFFPWFIDWIIARRFTIPERSQK
jgi:short-subunit dehydrogenase